MDILLNDVFHLSSEKIENAKISLNISSGKNAPLCLDSWLKDGSTCDGFCAYSGNQRNFKVKQDCYAFYKMDWSGNRYLFVGAGTITRVPDKNESIIAEYKPIDSLQNLVGRLIIDVYKGNTRGRYNFWLKKYLDNCKVSQILPERYCLKDFPGYNNILVDYSELYRGIYLNESWKTALKLQKGIYLITDKAPESEYSGLGRLYVGSATNKEGMLYSRWKNYVDTYTGNNTELKKVKELKGEDYIKQYFQWTLIENFDASIDDEEILNRERYWKRVLKSVEHGLNDNY